jgi:hypothetical protein
MKADKKIEIILPAYNEASRILPTLRDIQRFNEEYDLIARVTVVDDGSTDSTVEIVKMFAAQCKTLSVSVLPAKVNGGKWSAIWRGIREAREENILLLDADGSASVWELEQLMVDGVFRRPLDAIYCGSRFAYTASVEGKPLGRQIVSRGYRWFVRKAYRCATGIPCAVDDMQAPWKLFSRNMSLKLQSLDVMEGVWFTSAGKRFAGDLLFMVLCSETAVINIPVRFKHVRGGSIKLSTVWSMFWETVQVVRWSRKNKLHHRYH